MWDWAYCPMDIPSLPDTAGNYTMDIYFNSMYVASQNFTIE